VLTIDFDFTDNLQISKEERSNASAAAAGYSETKLDVGQNQKKTRHMDHSSKIDRMFECMQQPMQPFMDLVRDPRCNPIVPSVTPAAAPAAAPVGAESPVTKYICKHQTISKSIQVLMEEKVMLKNSGDSCTDIDTEIQKLMEKRRALQY